MLISLVILAFSSSACTMHRYEPVRDRGFEEVLSQGCGGKGERVTTTALINRVYRNSLILWDGESAATTYSVELVEPGLGAKTAGVIGKNRFERARDTLRELMAEHTPVTVTLTCRGSDRPPLADRFSFTDDTGSRRTYELRSE